jgi:hypothetical protein
VRVTKFSRLYFQLQVSVPRTEGNEFSLLPTPQALEAEKGSSQRGELINGNYVVRRKKTGAIYGARLIDVVGLLPTPTVMDTGGNLEKMEKRRAKALEKGINGNGIGTTLLELLNKELLPTPSAGSDWKGGSTRSDPRRQDDTLANYIHGILGQPGGTSQLSGRYTLEMMGFPTDWTELPFLRTGAKR